ncbi:hypothetical protein [Botrimarina hoheduenensis]|uniref:PEP-CTERM protein-sorting domain-containing protein n=1 Tax=Botrimarina hoheduenensis TaxID=2528000 RepID=A0A5C5VYE2_9BACT|nr:hypothetical protein [Botrimarina hoheduenensis]TWT42759.1 hypothetical protein Pla111_27320 [Botrimarina hoheduenensis]
MLLRTATAIAFVFTGLFAATSSEAALINTIIGNFDIAFDGATGELTDFNRPLGGNLNPAEARTFSSFEVEVGGSTAAMLMNPPDALFGDLLIGNLGSELSTGALVSNAGGTGNPTAFGFDFFTATGHKLQIGIADINYVLVTTPIASLNFFNWFAEGKVVGQSLPNGIEYAEDVLVSFTATEVMVINGQNGIRSLVASGAMTITGEMAIPEPTSLALVASTLLAGVTTRRRV